MIEDNDSDDKFLVAGESDAEEIEGKYKLEYTPEEVGRWGNKPVSGWSRAVHFALIELITKFQHTII